MKNDHILINPKNRVVDKADRKTILGILCRKCVMGIRGYKILYRPKAMVNDIIH